MNTPIPCECCPDAALRVVPLETGTGFLSLVLCAAHFKAFRIWRARELRREPVRAEMVQ